MKLAVLFLAAILLAGCQSGEATPDSTADAPLSAAGNSTPLQIAINGEGDLQVGDSSFDITDLPAVLERNHAKSVVIIGTHEINDFRKAMEVEKAVKAAGIQDVTISPSWQWEWYGK